MNNKWNGDSSLYWKYDDGADYVQAVAVTCCNEAGGYDNRFMVESGTMYFGDDYFNRALESLCYGGKQDVPRLPDLLYGLQSYCGIERDSWNGESYVQIGRKPQGQGENGLGSNCEPDYILHGNRRLESFICSEFLN
jgi:hypothetical protein